MRELLPENFFVNINEDNLKQAQEALCDLRLSYNYQNIRDCLKSPYGKYFLCVKKDAVIFTCHDWIKDFYMKDKNSTEVSIDAFIDISRTGIPIDYDFEKEFVPSSVSFCQGV